MNTVQSYLARFRNISAPSDSMKRSKWDPVRTAFRTMKESKRDEVETAKFEQALAAWSKWKSENTPIDDYAIEMFCSHFLEWKTLENRDCEVKFKFDYYNELYGETKFSNDDIEQFCLEFMAAKALSLFAYKVAMGGKKPCKGCGMEIYDFAKYSSKPHYRAQTECEDCRFVDYSGMDDDDYYDDYHGGDYRQEQYDQWRDFAKNECS